MRVEINTSDIGPEKGVSDNSKDPVPPQKELFVFDAIAPDTKYSVDKITSFNQVAFISGWANLTSEGGKLEIYITV